jgi:putative ABC transport system substrate-binding protein
MPRKLTATAALLLALLACAGHAGAGEPAIAVVFNPGIRPYEAFLAGFKSALRSPVVEVPLKGNGPVPGPESLRTGHLKLLVAVGIDALTAVEPARDLPVLATMIPDLRRRMAAAENRFGLEMAIAPARHLEAVHRLFPAARRIGVLYDPRSSGEYLREAGTAAAALGLTLVPREVGPPRETVERLAGLKGAIDVFWMLPEPALAQPDVLDALFLFSFQNRVPVYSFARKYVAVGAVAALTVDPFDLGVQAARLVDTAAAPDRPGGAPRWRYATENALVVNRKVAEKMGLTLGADAARGAVDAGD